jgi:hypothetical protein
VAGPGEPVVIDGITGRDHARALLACLAELPGSPDLAAAPLLDRLATMTLPPGPTLVVSTRAGDLAAAVARRLHRPAAGLDAAHLEDCGFYEAPPAP